MKLRRVAPALVLRFLAPSSAQAEYKVTVTAPPGFAGGLSWVAIVTTECGEGLTCRDIEQQVRVELSRMQPGFQVVRGLPEALLSIGAVDYSTDLRAELAETLQVDALLDLTVPRGEKGVYGWKGSEATVGLQLVSPTGEVLMAGEGPGRARNTLSTSENIARATAERILKQAFRQGGGNHANKPLGRARTQG